MPFLRVPVHTTPVTVELLKEQATLLQDFLANGNVKLVRQNALAAIACINKKPDWNTLVAELGSAGQSDFWLVSQTTANRLDDLALVVGALPAFRQFFVKCAAIAPLFEREPLEVCFEEAADGPKGLFLCDGAQTVLASARRVAIATELSTEEVTIEFGPQTRVANVAMQLAAALTQRSREPSSRNGARQKAPAVVRARELLDEKDTGLYFEAYASPAAPTTAQSAQALFDQLTVQVAREAEPSVKPYSRRAGKPANKKSTPQPKAKA